MNGGAPLTRIRVREPAGARELDLPLTVGSAGAHVVIPGLTEREQLRFESRDGQLLAAAGSTTTLQLNGAVVEGEQLLGAGDVLAVGAARILLQSRAGGPLEIEVRHLTGNDTVPPLTAALANTEGESADADILIAASASATEPHALARSVAKPGVASAAPRRAWIVALALLLIGALLLLWRVETVTLTLEPQDTRVHADGLISWQSANAIAVWPGERQLRAERSGYRTLSRSMRVVAGAANSMRIELQKLPGLLDVDSGGVPATALVDGEAVGRVPGTLQVSAGKHTLLLRAERYLDAVLPLDVSGMGQRQTVRLRLNSSWGRLEVSSSTAGARLTVNDGAAQALPASIDLPGGVQRLRVAAPGARDWLSSVLIKPGATNRVGPIVLGAPDAQLSVRSQPAGATVTVAGVWRGRTPLQLSLPAGARYEVLVAQIGYESATRTFDAAAAAKLTMDARLKPILVGLNVSGDPPDAELWIDGATHGRTPAALQFLAGAHRVEVRRGGMQTWSTDVELAPGVARALEYRLIPEGRPAGWTPPPSSISTKSGATLRLVNGGVFLMGSGRREQGRRPNEGQVRVTLSKPYYIGTHEVTNAEFRRFRADHVSGVVDQRSLDLDNQAVTNVTWEQAVEYCNWLSSQEGLPAAYESKDGSWVLHQPANNGYRLPTEAEWEFAARVVPGGQRRFEWGDELPIPPGIGNIAGAEAAKVVDPVLPTYRDEFVAVAPVGRFNANAWGLFDMTGNVSEWTHDVYTSFIDSVALTDPLGPAAGAGHTVRGSSWRAATIAELRLAWREGASEPSQEIGFRLARYTE
jgi:formylglycine-generating enzyme required for sulfatase activity